MRSSLRSSLFWSPPQPSPRELRLSSTVEQKCAVSRPGSIVRIVRDSPEDGRAEDLDLERDRAGDPRGVGEPSVGEPSVGEQHALTLQLGDFAHDTIDEEAARLGISVEELATFAVLYYLADMDSGRIAREIPASLYPGIVR
jgi:hypothetical protein